MNSEKISEPTVNTGDDQLRKTISLDELMALGTPIGTFGGSMDILLRIRNGKPITANAGGQGGGQN
jgi:hypothetical protein